MNAGHKQSAKYPKTLVEAVRYFSDPNVTLDFFVSMRWPAGVACPHCGSTNVHFLANQLRWKCGEKHARRQFTVKIGTVMEESPMSLDKWAIAFWLEVNAKNSISSYELHRALGITQKSAWFMLHRIRHAMQSGSLDKMGDGGKGIEADETYIGGAAHNMHASKRKENIRGRGAVGKTAVMGLLERHSEKKCSTVRAAVVADTKQTTLQPIIRSNVQSGTAIYTDVHGGYAGLSDAYIHEIINHAECYVRGEVHTNGLENFWSLFKRCIKGTHVSIEPYHLCRYLDSEVFRFNNRELNDGERFLLAMKGMDGKRLTYKALTTQMGFHPTSDGSDGASENVLPN